MCIRDSRITGFTYTGHRIFAGKKPLEGLPATYVEDDEEACSLELYLEDSLIRVRLVLSYTIYSDFPIIARNARFECLEGCQGIRLEQAMSLSLDLPDSRYTMLDLAGAWGRERYPDFHPPVSYTHLEKGLLSGTSISKLNSPVFPLCCRFISSYCGWDKSPG